MTTNYEKALKLVDQGFACKHFYPFQDTGYVFIDLGGRCGGYAFPKNKYVEVIIGNAHIGYGNIDLDRLMVLDASHRSNYDRHIVKLCEVIK